MPDRVWKDKGVTGLSRGLHRAGRMGVWRTFSAFREGAHMAPRKQSEVATVRAGHVAEQIQHLHGKWGTGFGDTNTLLPLAAIGMDVAAKVVMGGTHDRLRHGELDIGSHDIDDQVEDSRLVDEVYERLMVGEQVAPIHERGGVWIRMIDPCVMAKWQVTARRLVARQQAYSVKFVAEKLDLFRT